MLRKKRKQIDFTLQIGNFIISLTNDKDHQWLHIMAVSGFWSIQYRDDNLMFARILTMAKETEFHKYLESYIYAVYALSCATPDWEYLNEFAVSYSALMERYKKASSTPTEEEDAKVIEEMTMIEDMRDFISE